MTLSCIPEKLSQYHCWSWHLYPLHSQVNCSQLRTDFFYQSHLTFYYILTHWGRVTQLCVSKLNSIGSDNGLSTGWRQAIVWTNAGVLLIEPWGTNFSEIIIKILIFLFKKMHLKMLSGKWRPFCLGLNVLKFNTQRVTSICIWLKLKYRIFIFKPS